MLTESLARGPSEPEVRDITLGGLLEWAAATTPNRIALITPRHWFAVESMPLTGSGKIQKFKLRDMWSKGEFREL